MASFSRRERTTTWVEYTLTSPVAWGEIHKVIAVIREELGDRAQWDDEVQVLALGDEIVFRFEKGASNGS